MKSKQNKHYIKKDKDKGYAKLAGFLMLITAILAIALLVTLFSAYLTLKNMDEKYVLVPKNLGATYYTPSGAFVRFDTSDWKQARLLSQVEQACVAYDFKNCQNPSYRLNIGTKQVMSCKNQ